MEGHALDEACEDLSCGLDAGAHGHRRSIGRQPPALPMVLRICPAHGLGRSMQRDVSDGVRHMLGRIPQWLRVQLSSSDAMLRERAEDALSAMIVAALAEPVAAPEPVPPSARTSMKGLTTDSTGI